MGEAGLVPTWMDAIVKGHEHVAVGERHVTCYKLGATWAALGYELDRLYQVVKETSLSDIGDYDLRRALRNGYEANVIKNDNVVNLRG